MYRLGIQLILTIITCWWMWTISVKWPTTTPQTAKCVTLLLLMILKKIIQVSLIRFSKTVYIKMIFLTIGCLCSCHGYNSTMLVKVVMRPEYKLCSKNHNLNKGSTTLTIICHTIWTLNDWVTKCSIYIYYILINWCDW